MLFTATELKPMTDEVFKNAADFMVRFRKKTYPVTQYEEKLYRQVIDVLNPLHDWFTLCPW